MPNKPDVITVQLVGDASGLSQTFNIAQKDAEKLGQAIGRGLDTSATQKSLGGLNDTLALLAKNLQAVTVAMKAMQTVQSSLKATPVPQQVAQAQTTNIPYGSKNILLTNPTDYAQGLDKQRTKEFYQELGKSAETASKQVVAASETQSNAVKTVGKSFENLIALDKHYTSLGERNRASNVASFQNLSRETLAYEKISTNMHNSLVRQSEARIQRSRVETQNLIAQAKVTADAGFYQRASANAGLRANQRQIITADTLINNRSPIAKAAIAIEERIGPSLANAGVRVSEAFNRGLKGIDAFKSKLGTISETAATATKGFRDRFSSLSEHIANTGTDVRSRFSQIFAANFFAGIAYNAVSGFLRSLEAVSVETVKYAARTEELGVILGSLAKQNNISTQTITEQEVAIRRLNITTQDARETLARFINVGFDLNKAAPLARVAQDLAVISGLSSSDELNKLLVGIQTLQSRNLRTAGVYITVDEVLDKLSATSGRARDSFSTLEKQNAVLNAVMEYGTKVAGSYQAAMGTASKQARSLERQFFEAQNAIGEGFIPIMGAAVSATGKFLDTVAAFPGIFTRSLGVIALFSASLIALRTQAIQGLVSGVQNMGRALGDSVTSLVGGKTSQQILNATKKEELTIQLELAKLQARKQGQKYTEIAQQKEINALALEEAAIRARQAYGKTAAIGRQINALDNVSAGDKIAGIVGKVAVIGTVALLLYDIGKSIYEIANAPEVTTVQDINLIKKQAEDTNKLRQIDLSLQTQIAQLSSGQVLTEDQKKTLQGQQAEIAQKVTLNNQASLDIALKQVDVLQQETQLRDVIRLQIQTNNTAQSANIELASQNIQNAFKNFFEQNKILEEQQKAIGTASQTRATFDPRANLTRLQNIRNNLSSQESSARSKGAPVLQDNSADLAYLKELNISIEDLNKAFSITQGQFDEFGKQSTVTAKAQAELNTFIKDGASIAASYGITLRELIDIRARLLAKTPEEQAVFQKQVDEYYKGQIAEFAARTSQFQDASERFATLSKDFNATFNAQLKSFGESELAKIQQQFANGILTTPEQINAAAEASSKAIANFATLYGQSYAKEKENVTAFYGAVSQGIATAESEGKKFTVQEKIAALTEQMKKNREVNPLLVHSILDQGSAFESNTKFAQKWAESLRDARTELENVTLELGLFLNESAEQRDIGFQIQAKKELLSTVRNISQLEYELGKTPTDLTRYEKDIQGAKGYEASLQRQKKLSDDITAARIRLKELKDGPNKELDGLQRQLKVEEAIYAFRNKQRDIEEDIAILKVTSVLPAINAEFLAQKSILQTVQDRKQAEQQLTADIAVEIDKRKRYGLDSASVVAQTFLELQKEESQTQGDAVRSFLKLQAAEGNAAIFKDNPLIREAVKQSDRLTKVTEKGDIQIAKLDEGNNIAKTSQAILGQASNNITKIGTDIVNAISQAPAFNPSSTGTGVSDYANIGGDANSFASTFKAVFQQGGIQPGGILWMLANLKRETGFNLGTTQRYVTDPVGNGSRNAGAFQWNSSGRLAQYEQFLRERNLTVSTARAVDQAQFALQELRTNRRFAGAYRTLTTPNLPDEQYYKATQSYVGFSDSATKGQVVNGRFMSWREINRSKNLNFAKQLGYSGGLQTSFTSQVAQQIKSKPADKNNYVNFDALAAGFGLTPEEAKKSLQDLDKDKKTFTDIENALAVTGTIKKAFGTVDVDASQFGGTTNTFNASKTYTEERTKKLADVDISKAMRAIRIVNAESIRALEQAEEFEKYSTELNEESLFGQSRRANQLGIVTDRLGRVQTAGSPQQAAVLQQARIDRINQEIELQNELLKTEEELYYRRFEATRRDTIEQKKYNDEKQKEIFALQDALDKAGRDAAFQNSEEGRRVIENQVYLERLNNATSLNAELIKLENDYTNKYAQSAENRKRIADEYRKSVLEQERDIVTEIIRLQTQAANIDSERRLGDLNLAKKYLEVNNDIVNKERERVDLLSQQIENEKKLRDLTLDNEAQIRTTVQSHVLGAMKSNAELVSGVWTDTFDAINGGFGSLVDKMTSKMGIFGNVVGNFIKGVFGRVFGSLTNGLLDKLYPRDPALDKAKDDASSIANTVTENILPKKLSDLSVVSDTTTAAILSLGKAAAAVANAMLGIAGQSGATALQAAAVTSSGISNLSTLLTTGPLTNNNKGAGQGSGRVLGSLTGSLSQLGNVITGGQAAITSQGSGLPTNLGAILGSGPLTNANAGANGAGSGRILGSITGILGGGSKGGFSGLFKALNLKGIGGSLIASAPMFGASLGGLLGGSSRGGSILGQAGGLLGSVAGLGAAGLVGGALGPGSILGGLFGGGSLLGGLFGGIGSSVAGLFGSTTMATSALAGALGATVVLAPIAGALLLGAYFLGRNKKRREEEKIRNQAMTEALPQLQKILQDVRTDKLDGDSALQQATDLRKSYIDQMSKLKDKKTRNIALADVSRIDTIISQIKVAAGVQRRRKEFTDKVVPTYATGGVSSGSFFRVSQGETLYPPSALGNMGGAFANAKIPGFESGGITVPGVFDRKDNILVYGPKGTVIATPQQKQMINQSRGFATGGVYGAIVQAAQPNVAPSTPIFNITAVLVMSPEEAAKVVAASPDAVVVDKVRTHIKTTGKQGIAGDVLSTFR